MASVEELKGLSEYDLAMFASYVAGADPDLFDRALRYTSKALCRSTQEKAVSVYYVRCSYLVGKDLKGLLMGVAAYDIESAENLALGRMRKEGYDSPLVILSQAAGCFPHPGDWGLGRTYVYSAGSPLEGDE